MFSVLVYVDYDPVDCLIDEDAAKFVNADWLNAKKEKIKKREKYFYLKNIYSKRGKW